MSSDYKKENEPGMNAGDEDDDLSETVTEPGIERPPKPPGPALGPYYQFITTDLEKMQWLGSVLIFRHISFDQPKIEFISEVKVDYDWEILYENLFEMRAYRVNLSVELRPGEGDEKIIWKIDWGNYSTDGTFYIAQYNQKWRGAFFSCNGFDATIPKDVATGLNYDHVWNHLLSIHEKTPLHILLWGGDQSYNDFVLEDIQFLQDWANLAWDDKWTWEFQAGEKQELEQYYFNTYAQHWECRPEMKRALSSVPGMMMWDDHDIFDGAGSYPTLLIESPVMTGLFEAAQKMRLLFQHHTTPEKVREHRLFGYRGHNIMAHCGPDLVILATDGRTERDEDTVQHEKTWNIIFDRLDSDLRGVKHLIVLFPVPFSYVRFTAGEYVLNFFKKFAKIFRNVPIVNHRYSVFGLPELYDDLLDEWTHDKHIEERNRVLSRFQEIARRTKARITFFSGDVHCCGISRFRTIKHKNAPPPANDPKLMYQIISSAIVNMPPSRRLIQAIHFMTTKWFPIYRTQEELINFFQYTPENRAKLFFKKLLPNRNWCYFEQCTGTIPTVTTLAETGHLQRVWSFITYILFFLSLGWLFNWKGQKRAQALTRTRSLDSPGYREIKPDQETDNLLIRLWLESEKPKKGKQHFENYDLLIPNLLE